MPNGSPSPPSFVSKDEIKGMTPPPTKAGTYIVHAKEKRSEYPEENRDLAKEALLAKR
jgi:hypothetical protein